MHVQPQVFRSGSNTTMFSNKPLGRYGLSKITTQQSLFYCLLHLFPSLSPPSWCGEEKVGDSLIFLGKSNTLRNHISQEPSGQSRKFSILPALAGKSSQDMRRSTCVILKAVPLNAFAD